MKNQILTVTEKILYSSISFFGVVSLVIGLFLDEAGFKLGLALQGLGGALFGVGASSLLTSMRHFDHLARIDESLESFLASSKNLLNSIREEGFRSDQKLLKKFADKRLHAYHITKTRACPSGVWVYTIMEFMQGTPSTLSTTQNVIGCNEDKISYNIEAGVRGERLIWIVSPCEGKERPSIYIFPTAGTNHQGSRWGGVVLGETFVGDDALRAAILSFSPLIDQQAPGFVSEDKLEELNNAWKNLFFVDTIFLV